MLLECFFDALAWCVYVLLHSISCVCSRTQGLFPALLQGSDSIAFQAHIFTAESSLTISMRFTMSVSQIRLFLMHAEIICIATCTSLGGKYVVLFIKWTILLYSSCIDNLLRPWEVFFPPLPPSPAVLPLCCYLHFNLHKKALKKYSTHFFYPNNIGC